MAVAPELPVPLVAPNELIAPGVLPTVPLAPMPAAELAPRPVGLPDALLPP